MLTQILRNMEPRRPRLFGLFALVLGMLLLMTLVVRQAWRADQEREQLGERFLERTAVLAAGNWARVAEAALVNSLRAALGPVEAVVKSTPSRMPSADAVRAAVDLAGVCECLDPADVDYAFTVDVLDERVDATRPLEDGEARALVRRLAGAQFALHANDFGVALQTGVDSAGEPVVYAFMVRLAGGQTPVAAYGFAAPPLILDWFFRQAFTFAPLVGPELLRAGRNDSTFVLALEDGYGRILYRTAELLPEAHGTRQPLERLLTGMVVVAQVQPLAETAIVGGSFRSRSALLIVLFLFTTGVAAFALWLIRRETQLAELRDNFIAGVSHELRTPLTQIRMFAESLRLGRMRSPADRRRSLDIIDQESRRLAHLVENVLQFARLGRGDVRLRLDNVDLASDVRDAIHAFAVVNRSPDLEIRAELQEHVVASIDRDRVRQILVNLLENAAKYGPISQRITVGMALVGGRVRLWVDDEGPGIPAAERERVFDEFYRLSRDAGSAVAGTGIGLAIVRQMARAHGGDVQIEDAPGGGARVIVELPEGWLRPESTDAAVVA